MKLKEFKLNYCRNIINRCLATWRRSVVIHKVYMWLWQSTVGMLVCKVTCWVKCSGSAQLPDYRYRMEGKVGRRERLVGESLANWLVLSIWRKKVQQINRFANRLSIISTNLNSFSLANHRRFAKFANVSPCQSFPPYGMVRVPNRTCILHQWSN